MRTIGLSPKVLVPALIGLVVGVIFILTGDNETGRTVLLSTLAYGGIGAAAGPGNVTMK